MLDSRIEQALRLLMSVESDELSVKEAVAIIELVSNVPEHVRDVLRAAEELGLIKRRESSIIINRGQPIHDLKWLKPKIKKGACNDNCKRCGRKISLCHYIELDGSTIGPFGSDCLKRLKIALA